MSIFGDWNRAARGTAAPVTASLVVAMAAMYLLLAFRFLPLSLLDQLGFKTSLLAAQPWSVLTYPFVNPDVVSTAFGCLWLWWVGGAVERDLGKAKYVVVWLLTSVLSALCVLLGALIIGREGVCFGAWACVSALTVIWATRNPSARVLLMFIVPVEAKWIGWISVALVGLQTKPIALAPFAALPLLLAYLFAANKLPIQYSRYDRRYLSNTKKTERYDRKYYEEVRRREQDRAERERLRKLFESSVNDEDKK